MRRPRTMQENRLSASHPADSGNPESCRSVFGKSKLAALQTAAFASSGTFQLSRSLIRLLQMTNAVSAWRASGVSKKRI